MALGRLKTAPAHPRGAALSSARAALSVFGAVWALAACATTSPALQEPRVDASLRIETTTSPGPEALPADHAQRSADHEALAALTLLLGGPLPARPGDDVIGVEEPSFESTRAFVDAAPRLGGSRTKLRATAWRGRVHTLELTFIDACDSACMEALADALTPWTGPCAYVDEGHAHTCAVDVDTVRFTLEDYAARPELSRILVACRPLVEAASGRPVELPAVGMRAAPEPNPRCRALSGTPQP